MKINEMTINEIFEETKQWNYKLDGIAFDIIEKIKQREENKMTKELLSCPFCGCSPKYLHLDLPDSTRWAVKCQGCETRTAFLSEKLEVISKWNRRHTPTPESKKPKFHLMQDVYYVQQDALMATHDMHRLFLIKLKITRRAPLLGESYYYDAASPRNKFYANLHEEELFATLEEAKAELTRKIGELKEETE